MSDSSFEIGTRSKKKYNQKRTAKQKKLSKGLANEEVIESKPKRKYVKKTVNAATKSKPQQKRKKEEDSSDSEEFLRIKHALTREEEGYLIFPEIESDDEFKYCPEYGSEINFKIKSGKESLKSSCEDSDQDSSDVNYNFNNSIEDWFFNGELPTAFYHEPVPMLGERFNVLKRTHNLTGNLIEIKDSLKILKDKIKIAESDNHPKLHLWAQKWNHEEMHKQEIKLKRRYGAKQEKVTSEVCKQNLLEHITTKQNKIDNALDTIEYEIAALEGKAEQDGLPSYDFNSTLNIMQHLMTDLGTLKKIADLNAAVHERRKADLEEHTVN